jgi:predicted nuclease with RNAse H fold
MFAGFDPGGKGAFGCCLLDGKDPERSPRVHAAAVFADPADALEWAGREGGGGSIMAAGIDAPLHWVATRNWRPVDQLLRDALRNRAARRSVLHLNSLWGACAIQGIVLARLLQDRYPTVRVTEAHPKVARTILRRDDRRLVIDLAKEAVRSADRRDVGHHLRDAVLAAYAAWVMHERGDGWNGWRNIRSAAGSDADAVVDPLERPAEYWMPALPEGRARTRA